MRGKKLVEKVRSPPKLPYRDIKGKRPFYLLYTEPGLSVTNGHGTFTLSTPIRTSVHRELSVFDHKMNNTVAGGGFAKFLVFVSYSYRL